MKHTITFSQISGPVNNERTGSDVTQIKPVRGVIHYPAGTFKTPTQLIKINWEVDCSPGESICAADYGQYEIDCLVQAGYKILNVEPHYVFLQTITL